MCPRASIRRGDPGYPISSRRNCTRMHCAGSFLYVLQPVSFVSLRILPRGLRNHNGVPNQVAVAGTVDKVGGLDNYLTGTKTARVKELGPWGWKLRWEIMNSPVYQKKRAAELEALGLSATEAQVSIKQQIQEEEELEEPAPVQQEQKPELVADAAGNIKL